MVTSSNTGRWLFPKGMLESGMTPAESAELEAFEEAGVLGMAGTTPVSSYRYRKRGLGRAVVLLFPLLVQHELKKKKWEEARHRRREWVSLDEAEIRLEGTPMARVMADFREWIAEV